MGKRGRETGGRGGGERKGRGSEGEEVRFKDMHRRMRERVET